MTKGKGVGGGECQKKQPKTGKILHVVASTKQGLAAGGDRVWLGFLMSSSAQLYFLSICKCYFDEKLKFRSAMISLKEKH